MGGRLYDTVIFDCDGTLVDSEKLNNQACADALFKHGVTAYPYEYVLDHFGGMTMADIRKHVYAEQGVLLPEVFIEDFVKLAHQYKGTSLQPVSGAVAAVASLQKVFKTCVASNGERGLVFTSLRLTGLFEMFGEDRIFTRIQVVHGKPAPDLFLYAASHLGSAPQSCIVIEDSPSGVVAGVAAGMRVIGFTGAHHNSGGAEKLSQAGAKTICSSWPEILACIKELQAQRGTADAEGEFSQPDSGSRAGSRV